MNASEMNSFRNIDPRYGFGNVEFNIQELIFPAQTTSVEYTGDFARQIAQGQRKPGN